jgi:hypothetical protein
MIPLPLLYYTGVFVIGYLVGRFAKNESPQAALPAPQAAETVMDGIAKLAASGALDSIGDLEVKGGSEADGVQIKLTTRAAAPKPAAQVVSLVGRPR